MKRPAIETRPVTDGKQILRELADASPAGRRSLFLSLLGQGDGLDLHSSGDERAVLTDADFTAHADTAPAGDGAHRAAAGGVTCRSGRLTHAVMDRANWTGADLSGSDFSDSRARQAIFDRATLEGARFDRADLAGSTFRVASLGEAAFHEALLEDAVFDDAGLRFADFRAAVLEGASFQAADLWGAVLDGARLAGANLDGAGFIEGSLKGANLHGANLSGAQMERADLTGADLTDADLRGARLEGATLRGAVLRNARLEGVNLSTCDLVHVHLGNAWLERTLLDPDQLGGCVGEEKARAYEPARRAYLSLQRNFETLGNGDAASWAYRRRRRMQKLEDRESARREWSARRRGRAAARYVNYLSDQAAELLCDYGESVPRVLTSMLVVVAVFAILYGVSGGVLRLPGGETAGGRVTRSPLDVAAFSLLTFASAGEGVGLVPYGDGIHLLKALESFLGIGLTGLLGFVLGNRINR